MSEKDSDNEGEKFEQQSLVPDNKGGVFVGSEDNDSDEKIKRYPALRVEKGKYKVEKKEENLVSFNKDIEIEAYSRGLRRYVPHLLKNNINAYVVESFKDKGKGELRCYCFEENLDEQTNRAELISRGYREFLDQYFPYFFAHKNKERKAKPSKRLANKKVD